MESNTSQLFKACLMDNNSTKVEVHRFVIKQKHIKSFEYLNQKLQSIFPQLKGKQFKIYWKDEEFDDIVIGDDNELLIALSAITSDVKKLYIKVVNTVNSSAAGANCQYIHKGVLCVVCGGEMKNYCYKCLECTKFDLCENCERQHYHPHHFMLRVSHCVPLEHGGKLLTQAYSIISKLRARQSTKIHECTMMSFPPCEDYGRKRVNEQNINIDGQDKCGIAILQKPNKQNNEPFSASTIDNSPSSVQSKIHISSASEKENDSNIMYHAENGVLDLSCEIESIQAGKYNEASEAGYSLETIEKANCGNKDSSLEESVIDLHKELDQVSRKLEAQNLDDLKKNDWCFVYQSCGTPVISSAEPAGPYDPQSDIEKAGGNDEIKLLGQSLVENEKQKENLEDKTN